jgi:hypothetical protein
VVSTRQLGIACLALLVLAIAAVISNADNDERYAGVIADSASIGSPVERAPWLRASAGSKLELITSDYTWDLAGDERELQSLEGQPVTVIGAAQNGVIHVSAVYRPRH